jgi:hypothetical protein
MSQAALRRLRAVAHGADLFADPGAGYLYPAFEGLEVSDPIKTYERAFQASDHDASAIAIGEREGGEVKFAVEGRSFGGAAPGAGSTIAATDGELGLFLKSVFGLQTKDTGSLTAAATTASVIKVASTALFTVGGFVGIVNPADGLFYARQIRSKNATDLTLDRALPFVPGVGVTVYASSFFTHAISGHQHLFFDAEGYDATPANGWRRSLFGCLGDVELRNLAANGKLMFGFSFKALDWSDANQGASQPAPVYVANLPATGAFVRQSRLWVGAAQLAVSELSFALGNEIQGKPATSAKNGVAEWRVVGYKPTLSFKTAIEDAAAANLRAAWKAGTALDLLVELTQGGPGNAFALGAPAAQIVDMKRVVVNGLDYEDVQCRMLRPSVAGVSAVTLGML